MTAPPDDRALLALYRGRRCRYSATVAKQSAATGDERLTVLLTEVGGPEGFAVAAHCWLTVPPGPCPLLRLVGCRVSFEAEVRDYRDRAGRARTGLRLCGGVRHQGRDVA